MEVLNKTDWENILSNNPEMISTLMYGSSLKRKKARDVDLFIIYSSKPPQKAKSYKNKTLFDINQVSLQDTYTKIRLWDIDFTDPILTGQTIKGSKEIEQNAKDYLLNNKPDTLAIDYIKKRSIESLIQTEQLLVQTKYELLLEKVQKNVSVDDIKKSVLKQYEQKINSSNFEKAINQLNYALSYHASATRYEKKQGAITFNDLINSPTNKAEELLIATRKYQKQNSSKDLGEFVNYYKKAESIIKR